MYIHLQKIFLLVMTQKTHYHMENEYFQLYVYHILLLCNKDNLLSYMNIALLNFRKYNRFARLNNTPLKRREEQ